MWSCVTQCRSCSRWGSCWGLGFTRGPHRGSSGSHGAFVRIGRGLRYVDSTPGLRWCEAAQWASASSCGRIGAESACMLLGPAVWLWRYRVRGRSVWCRISGCVRGDVGARIRRDSARVDSGGIALMRAQLFGILALGAQRVGSQRLDIRRLGAQLWGRAAGHRADRALCLAGSWRHLWGDLALGTDRVRPSRDRRHPARGSLPYWGRWVRA